MFFSDRKKNNYSARWNSGIEEEINIIVPQESSTALIPSTLFIFVLFKPSSNENKKAGVTIYGYVHKKLI